MAEQKIPHADGTVTVISDSYSPYGQINVGAPERKDDPSKWRAKTTDTAEVEKRYGLTVEELRRSNFPEAHRWGFRPSRLNFWRTDRIEEWRESDLLEWQDRIRAIADKLPKRR